MRSRNVVKPHPKPDGEWQMQLFTLTWHSQLGQWDSPMVHGSLPGQDNCKSNTSTVPGMVGVAGI